MLSLALAAKLGCIAPSLIMRALGGGSFQRAPARSIEFARTLGFRDCDQVGACPHKGTAQQRSAICTINVSLSNHPPGGEHQENLQPSVILELTVCQNRAVRSEFHPTSLAITAEVATHVSGFGVLPTAVLGKSARRLGEANIRGVAQRRVSKIGRRQVRAGQLA